MAAEETFTVESAETGKNTVKLTLNDGTVLLLGSHYLPPEIPEVFLYTGAVIEKEQRSVLEHAAECRRAEKSALALIARAEQYSRGLRRKLEKKKHPPAAVQSVLDRLVKLELINDRRYAELWLKPRLAKGNKGPRMLLQLIKARGIDHDTAETALAVSLTPDIEAALLRRCLEKAARKKPSDAITAYRLFLKHQGFSAGAINQYFEEA